MALIFNIFTRTAKRNREAFFFSQGDMAVDVWKMLVVQGRDKQEDSRCPIG